MVVVSPLWVWEEVEQVWIEALDEAYQLLEEISHHDQTDIARARLLYWDNYPWQMEDKGLKQGCDFWRL